MERSERQRKRRYVSMCVERRLLCLVGEREGGKEGRREGRMIVKSISREFRYDGRLLVPSHCIVVFPFCPLRLSFSPQKEEEGCVFNGREVIG